eukprot:7387739-Prymnesium_polylepis.2
MPPHRPSSATSETERPSRPSISSRASRGPVRVSPFAPGSAGAWGWGAGDVARGNGRSLLTLRIVPLVSKTKI